MKNDFIKPRIQKYGNIRKYDNRVKAWFDMHDGKIRARLGKERVEYEYEHKDPVRVLKHICRKNTLFWKSTDIFFYFDDVPDEFIKILTNLKEIKHEIRNEKSFKTEEIENTARAYAG